MARRLALCALTLAACGGTRGHEQLAGRYALQTTEVISDPCGLLPPGGPWGGTLTKSGDYVRFDSDFLSLILVGYFRHSVEEFFLDGSASNPQAPGPDGGTCSLYEARMHIDGITRSPARFDGTLSVHYDVPGPDACQCALEATFQANLQ